MQLGAHLCWRWIGWTILFYNDCWRTSRPVHKCQTNLNCLSLALITFCKNQIVGKNLSIVAQWWTLCESHLLRLYFSVFQPSVLITFNGTYYRDKLETFLGMYTAVSNQCEWKWILQNIQTNPFYLGNMWGWSIILVVWLDKRLCN